MNFSLRDFARIKVFGAGDVERPLNQIPNSTQIFRGVCAVDLVSVQDGLNILFQRSVLIMVSVDLSTDKRSHCSQYDVRA